MSAGRVRVSAEEVKAKWFSDDAVQFGHDQESDEVFVRMRDGSEYGCSFADHSALLRGDGA